MSKTQGKSIELRQKTGSINAEKGKRINAKMR